MRTLFIIAAIGLALGSSVAHAGAWPEIDDLFRLENGALLVVTKVRCTTTSTTVWFAFARRAIRHNRVPGIK